MRVNVTLNLEGKKRGVKMKMDRDYTKLIITDMLRLTTLDSKPFNSYHKLPEIKSI